MHAPEHTHTNITMQEAAYSHLMDLIKKQKKQKTHHNMTCGWDELPRGKGNRGLGPEDRAAQSDREK